MSVTKTELSKAIARSLREFGYPDVTADMIDEIVDAYVAGKRNRELPHGIIGMFASRSLDELEEARPGSVAEIALLAERTKGEGSG